MTPSRSRLVWPAAALALFMPACGSDTTTSPTTTTSATTSSTGTATVTVVITPSPVSASSSPDGGFSWTGAFVATVTNANSQPITINTITADLQQSSGGIVITPLPDTDESFRFEVAAPFNRIDTNGTMAIPFRFFYTLPNRGREATVTVTLAVTTDDSATGSVKSTVLIQ